MTTHDSSPMATTPADPAPATRRNGVHGDAVNGGAGNSDSAQPRLIDVGLTADYRARWQVVQGNFIDAPRDAVTDADAMVGEVLAHVGATFAGQRKALEQGWADDASDTEELRIALRRYRTFFDRLLTL